MAGTVVDAAAEKAKLGDIAGAAQLLADALSAETTWSAGERLGALQAFIQYLVTASRHREAYERAVDLEAQLGLPRVPAVWVHLLAFVVYAVRIVPPGGRLARVIGWAVGAAALRGRVSADAVRAVQLASFWYDIRACQRLSLVQLALSQSERETRRSLAWLGYSYAYAGRAALGLPILRAALLLAHRAEDEPTLVELYPLMAIAYQMSSRPRRALHYYGLFVARYGDKSSFYTMLAHTNALSALLALDRFDELKVQLDTCFESSFGLDASRHHLRIYGTYAVLVAVEGDTAQAGRALDRARRAAVVNDNDLDWAIYEQLAALTWLVVGRAKEAGECADRGLARCKAYGGGKAFAHARELRDLRAVALAPDRTTHRRSRLLEARARHLADTVRRQREQTADGKLSQLAEQLEQALRSHAEFDPSRPPTEDDLRVKLQRTFDTDCVVFAPSLAELKASVLRDHRMAGSAIATETEGELRLVCADSRFFIGLKCGTTSEFQEDLAVGVLFGRLDPLSESLVRAAFRLVLSQYVFVHSIRISREIQARQQRAAAIGAMAQMLAHDVRRPFRMLRTAIGVLERTRDPEDLRAQASLLFPEIELATNTADALIADLMEVSSAPVEARPEPIAPEALLRDALIETVRGHPSADVRFEYTLAHREAICVEAVKVRRVFSNILSNALQAMDHQGRIAVSTAQVTVDGRRFVEFTIANDGLAIAESDMANLFLPFFTRHKPNGTGLGLAIAHRIVTAHGGTIACVRGLASGAAFRFTLPATAAATTAPPVLPSHSFELAPPRAARPAAPRAGKSGAIPEVAIVDDSQAFLVGWRSALNGRADAHFFTSPEAFWRAVDADDGLLSRLTAVVTDYAFANSRQTGVSFARALKAKRPGVPVFLSSSGYVSPRETAGAIDSEIDKEAPSWKALLDALERTSAPGRREAS